MHNSPCIRSKHSSSLRAEKTYKRRRKFTSDVISLWKNFIIFLIKRNTHCQSTLDNPILVPQTYMGSLSCSFQSLSMHTKELTPQGARYTVSHKGTKQSTRKETQQHQVFDSLKDKCSHLQRKFYFLKNIQCLSYIYFFHLNSDAGS